MNSRLSAENTVPVEDTEAPVTISRVSSQKTPVAMSAPTTPPLVAQKVFIFLFFFFQPFLFLAFLQLLRHSKSFYLPWEVGCYDEFYCLS